MKYVIVDTGAFSHLWQNTAGATALSSHLTGAVPVISFTTVAEVHFGAAKKGWGQRRVDQLSEGRREDSGGGHPDAHSAARTRSCGGGRTGDAPRGVSPGPVS